MSEKEKPTADETAKPAAKVTTKPAAKVKNGKVEISDDARSEIRARARAKAEDQLAREALKAEEQRIFEEELEAARREAGLITGTEDDGLVNVVIDLPEPDVTSCLLINFKAYHHGYTYTVPRHVARSMQEMMFRQRRYSALEVDGKKQREFYRRPLNTTLNGVTGAVTGQPARIG